MMTPEPRRYDDSKSSLQHLLASDHARLDALFERLLAAFHADSHAELGPLWVDFDSRLRAHMALEERHILPELAQVNAAEAKALFDEHVRIRELSCELDIAVDLQLAREATIVELSELLRDHATREEALMYRWANSNLRVEQRRKLWSGLKSAASQLLGKAGARR